MMDRGQQLDGLHAASQAAYDVLVERGFEDFVCVLVVDDIASTQVSASDHDVRRDLEALVNGQIVLEGLLARRVRLN
jgi:hypothetical protein